MIKRILFAAAAVVVGVPLLMTAWFYIGGIETGDTSLPDDADLRWTPPEVADEDNAFVAIIATTNLINTANFEKNRCGGGLPELWGEEPGAAEEADRIIDDNAAFFWAFARGLERKGFRNTLPPLSEEIRFSALPFHVMNRMSNLWQIKIRREMDRGEWNAAVADLDVLHRFGRVVSDNAALITDLMVANRIECMACGIIQDLVSYERLSVSQLARFAELVDDDAKVAPENAVRVVKAEYANSCAHLDAMSPEFVLSLAGWTFCLDNILTEICADVLGVRASDESFSNGVAEFLIRTIVRWPGYFRYTLHRRTTRKRLADIARKALKGEVDEAAYEDSIQSLFARNAFGRGWLREFAVTCHIMVAGAFRLSPRFARARTPMFARARTQLVIAAARWRLDHDGEMPPTLDALVPKYLPAVPLDPWSKDGKPLSYDAATGVVWSVGESGDFDYSKLSVEKDKDVREDRDKTTYPFAFRLDGKPLRRKELIDIGTPSKARQN